MQTEAAEYFIALHEQSFRQEVNHERTVSHIPQICTSGWRGTLLLTESNTTERTCLHKRSWTVYQTKSEPQKKSVTYSANTDKILLKNIVVGRLKHSLEFQKSDIRNFSQSTERRRSLSTFGNVASVLCSFQSEGAERDWKECRFNGSANKIKLK